MFGVPILAILAVVAIVAICLMGYVKAPPDMAYIISGPISTRTLIGKAGVKVPFLERVDVLCLGQVSVDIKTEQSVPTNDFINVTVDAVAKIRVADSQEGIKLAARNFLNKDLNEIASDLQDSLQGNMREIIGTLSLEEINTNRDAFSDQVVEKAQKDMTKLGIEVISCNIQNVTDEHGLIKDLGADNTAKIRKNASIAKAIADRDVAIASATADKEANDARVQADMEIAERQTELAKKKAELKREADIKQAEADAAYKIQEQEQEKAIQTATVNAEIAKAEREAELRRQQVEVKQQELAAEIERKADADKYKVEQEAQADLARRQREAEATAYEKKQEAEAQKALADAQKYQMEQEAAGIRAKGEAEAAAIRAKGEAEAAAMDKKAEAMRKYGDAAKAQMVVEVLPQVVAEIAKPMAAIDKVTIIGGGGNGSGVSTLSDQIPGILAKTFESVKETTGVDLGEIMRAQTYDAKVNKNINISGLGGKAKSAFDDIIDDLAAEDGYGPKAKHDTETHGTSESASHGYSHNESCGESESQAAVETQAEGFSESYSHGQDNGETNWEPEEDTPNNDKDI